MSKTVTLRLQEEIYEMFRNMAKDDNRSISNFIETAVLKFIESEQYADEFEMDEIRLNKSLNNSLKRAHEDAINMKGQFVD